MTSQRFSILCVDDEPENVQMLMRVLRDTYDVFGASSGPEALELLKTQKIHAVIADQRMPEMTGLEFLHRVRTANEDILLFMASGYLDLNLVIEATNLERIHGYFQKPLETSNLKMILKREFERFALYQQNRDLLTKTQAMNQELQRLNEVKSGFLRMISHELQSPLNAMVSAARMLHVSGQSLSTPDSRMLLDSLQSQGTLLSSLIQDLMFLLQIEGKGAVVRNEMIGFHQLLSGLMNEFHQKIESLQLVIDVNGAEDVTVQGDPDAIARMLRNLLDNSIRFAPNGGRINVEFKPVGDRIEVRLSEVWRPAAGYDHDDSEHRHREANIGLALARAVIEAHGGSMRLESRPESGKIFAFSLPAARRS